MPRQSDGRFRCHLCTKSYTRSFALQSHQAVHTGERSFHCTAPGCGKSFRSNDHLQTHKVTHSSDRKFLCSGCGARFARSCILRRHERSCKVIASTNNDEQPQSHNDVSNQASNDSVESVDHDNLSPSHENQQNAALHHLPVWIPVQDPGIAETMMALGARNPQAWWDLLAKGPYSLTWCQNAWFLAAKEDNENALAHLHNHAGIKVDLQNKDWHGGTALHLASYLGSHKALKKLLALSAQIDALTEDGQTPLHAVTYALKSRREPRRVDSQKLCALELIKGGSDVDSKARDFLNTAPLLDLAECENAIEVFSAALEHSKDVNARDDLHHSVVHFIAWAHSDPFALHMAVQKGADVSAKNKAGQTLLHLASQRLHTLLFTRQFLIHSGLMNETDDDGRTILHVLGVNSCPASQNDDHPQQSCGEGCRASQFQDCLDSILRSGANINAVDKRGDTPLMCHSRYHEVAAFLKRNAAVNIVNYKRKTALDLLLESKRCLASVDLLKSYGGLRAENLMLPPAPGRLAFTNDIRGRFMGF